MTNEELISPFRDAPKSFLQGWSAAIAWLRRNGNKYSDIQSMIDEMEKIKEKSALE